MADRVEAGDVAKQVVLLRHHSKIVPPQTVVQRDAWGQVVAILEISPVAVFECVPRRVPEIIKRLGEAGVQSAGQEIRKAAERQLSSKILIEKLLNTCAAELKAKLQVVLADFPGKVVNELIVGVHSMPGNGGCGAKLGETAHADDG